MTTMPSPAFTAAHTLLVEAADGLLAAEHRPDIDEYGCLLAQAVAMRGDCTRRRIGAIIIDGHKRPVGQGYNGAPSGAPGCLTAGACPRGRASYDEIPKDSPYSANCIALHAEENALLHSTRHERAGATIYVSDQPCPNCARLLRGSGLARVVWVDRATGEIRSESLTAAQVVSAGPAAFDR